MKTSAVALVASLGAAAAFQVASPLTAASTRSSTSLEMTFGKKKAAAAAPATSTPVGGPKRPQKPAAPAAVAAPAKKVAAAASKAASKAPAAASKAASTVKKTVAAPLKKAGTPLKRAAPAPVQTDFAVAFGSDVEAPFWDPAQLAADKPAETLDWYRAAELKHGRVAMLAALGTFINAAGISLPDPTFSGSTKSFDALAQVADQRPGALIQIVLGIAAVEALSLNLPEGSFPGDLGFDPANQIPVFEKQGKFDELRLKELKNGRLAMIGIAGMWVQEALTGQGVFEQLSSGHFSPVGDGQGYF